MTEIFVQIFFVLFVCHLQDTLFESNVLNSSKVLL